MKNKIELFLMKNFRSENCETRFWRKYDMTKVSEVVWGKTTAQGYEELYKRAMGVIDQEDHCSSWDTKS